MATKNHSECKFENRNGYVNQGISLALFYSSRLIPLEQLKPEHRALFLHFYGTPNTDTPKDGKNHLPGMDTLINSSEAVDKLQKACCSYEVDNNHVLEKSDPPTSESPLLKIVFLLKNGNKQGLRDFLLSVYSECQKRHSQMGILPLSHNQFFARLQYFLKNLRSVTDNDMRLLRYCIG